MTCELTLTKSNASFDIILNFLFVTTIIQICRIANDLPSSNIQLERGGEGLTRRE